MDKQDPQGQDVASSPLFKKFLGKAEEYVKKPTRMKQLLTDAYEKASSKKDMGSIAHEAWETMQTMFRLIKLSASGEYTGLPTTTVVAAVAVTIYFLSPIDLIPDFIPVLGLLDDVALVAWFSTTIQDELAKFAEWESTRPTLVRDTDEQPRTNSMTKTESSVSTMGQVGNMGSEANKPTATQATGTTSATQPDVAANTTDSSREPNFSTHDRPAGGDMGGNVR
ncbi:YkvA family protein [Hymenobacter sp. ISL-91]|uniref:YkvA family protein n=1 Tax=Hymenobacter sp. ISL-91 TaxID=2819151 RepID=UPI00397A4487